MTPPLARTPRGYRKAGPPSSESRGRSRPPASMPRDRPHAPAPGPRDRVGRLGGREGRRRRGWGRAGDGSGETGPRRRLGSGGVFRRKHRSPEAPWATAVGDTGRSVPSRARRRGGPPASAYAVAASGWVSSGRKGARAGVCKSGADGGPLPGPRSYRESRAGCS